MKPLTNISFLGSLISSDNFLEHWQPAPPTTTHVCTHVHTHTHTLTGGKEIYILNHHFFRWLGLKLHIVQLQLCDFADLRHHLSPHGLCNASFLVIETGNQFCPLASLPFCSGLLFPLYFSFGLFCSHV